MKIFLRFPGPVLNCCRAVGVVKRMYVEYRIGLTELLDISSHIRANIITVKIFSASFFVLDSVLNHVQLC